MSYEKIQTGYRVEKHHRGLKASRDNKLVCYCPDMDSMLHAIWVLEGKIHDDFYVADEDGYVFKVDRGAL